MRRLTFACLPLFCITTFAFGQGLPMAVPEQVGVSTEHLERIRPVMQGYVDDGRIAGLLTVAARSGK
ncbi:MAG: serine hydrolase, partial [Candidatus Poribacteria bacterium]|nr:serine hydrolase [Candidatus Poribacteria bacterium]